MRTLAIDLGTRRVGLALSDEGGRFVNPYDVLEVTSPAHALDLVRQVVARESARRLLLGVPLNMDGSTGPAARTAMRWGAELAKSSGVPIVFVDERLSSFQAEQQLADRKRAGEKLTRKRKKEQLDALVAANLLQQFLDGALPPLDGREGESP